MPAASAPTAAVSNCCAGDGQALTVIISGFSSSPDAGSIADLNEDGQMDLLLNNSDPYIFCYACGVRQYWAQLFYWDGQALVEVTPTPWPTISPPNCGPSTIAPRRWRPPACSPTPWRRSNRQRPSRPKTPQSPGMRSGSVTTLRPSRAEASASRYPLLNHVFAGDWETAFDACGKRARRPLSATRRSDRLGGCRVRAHRRRPPGPICRHCFEAATGTGVRSRFGAWGRFLLDPNDPAVKSGLRLAAELAPADDATRRWRRPSPSGPGAVSAPAAAPRPSAQALQSRLAAEYGGGAGPIARRGSKATEDRGGGGPGRRLYLWASAPESRRVAHRVAPSSPAKQLARVGRAELACVNYLDEHALQQVAIEPAGLWLTVQGGAGAHGGCLEVLRWDGQALSLVISSFNSIPDAGAVTDLNGDGQPDFLLNNSDPYIFCYACGLQRYMARFFHWDGEKLAEAAPRLLPEDRPLHLRAINNHALALAEAGLYADALDEIARAEIAAPSDPAVNWKRPLDTPPS